MADLIDRQEAIKALCKAGCDSGHCGVSCDDVKAIEDLPSADVQPVQRWIPCSERLPEKYIGEWLCCTDDGQILVLPYDTPGDGSKECVFYRWDDKWDMYETYNVVAWMPLPAPYDPLHGAMNPPEDDITEDKGEVK